MIVARELDALPVVQQVFDRGKVECIQRTHGRWEWVQCTGQYGRGELQ